MRPAQYQVETIGKRKVVFDRYSFRQLRSSFAYLFLPQYWLENDRQIKLPEFVLN